MLYMFPGKRDPFFQFRELITSLGIMVTALSEDEIPVGNPLVAGDRSDLDEEDMIPGKYACSHLSLFCTFHGLIFFSFSPLLPLFYALGGRPFVPPRKLLMLPITD